MVLPIAVNSGIDRVEVGQVHRQGLDGADPGLTSVSKDRLFYEPADAAIATENVWSTAKYLDHTPKLFEAIRPLDRERTVFGQYDVVQWEPS